MADLDGEKRVLATAQRIVRSLGINDNVTDDMLNIFSDFDPRFSAINSTMPKNLDPRSSEPLPSPTEVGQELKKALDAAEEVISGWENICTKGTVIFDSSSDNGAQYLEAVDKVQNILTLLSASKINDMENHAQNSLQVAMIRLQQEFHQLLAAHQQSLDPDVLFDRLACSFSSNREERPNLEFKSSLEIGTTSYPRDTSEDAASQSSVGEDVEEAKEEQEEEEEEENVLETQTDAFSDLLPLKVVKSLHEIAQRMISAGYFRECCQVYVNLRKPLLEQSLAVLGFENLSIDEVQRMTWNDLEGVMKKWIQAMNVAVKVLFASELKLCQNIFEQSDLAETCFSELSRTSITHLLNLGEAVAISRRSPEKLFKLLDMYETLRDLLEDLCAIFSGESCAEVRDEALEIWLRLGEAAKGTFAEFENAISKDTSRVPIPGGAVHPLARYVMNYVRFLFDYVDTLTQLIGENAGSSDLRSPVHDGPPPLGVRIISIINVLQTNLDEKSKLYKDTALTNLFLMNNLRYIVQKVNGSEMEALLGVDWLRKQTSLVRKYATDYQRSAWTKILACLRDEGIRTGGSFSTGVSKVILKERFKSFNSAFDDILKTQSGWLVPDSQLRLELRISIAEKLLPAYRSFLGRYRTYLEREKHSEKYIKYAAEDLETYLNDFFEGNVGSHQRSRSLVH